MAVVTGSVMAASAVAPSVGLWLSRWTRSRRRLAEKPICRKGGQVGQPFPDGEIVGVIDGGLGPQRPAFLVVLLDSAVLVVDVQAWGNGVGDDPGAEHPGGVAPDLPVEDNTPSG